MGETAFFQTEYVTDHIDAIRSATGEIMYLIKGEKEAFLIDTCLGVGDLKKVVESLTDLPVSVIITHGHVDHAMGAPEFETVYMNHADDHVQKAHRELPHRQGYIEANLGAAPGSWKDKAYIQPEHPDRYLELTDGMTFDLGEVHIEVYSLSGHTPGCMVVLIPEEKVLITGDAANNSLFLFDEFSLTVEEYRQNVIDLISKIQGRYDRCFMMHHDMEASGELLEHMVDVCNDILEGNVDDVPFDFMGGHYYIAKAIQPGFKRVDGGEGNIVYNKEKVHK